jgi:hypothetical protein
MKIVDDVTSGNVVSIVQCRRLSDRFSAIARKLPVIDASSCSQIVTEKSLLEITSDAQQIRFPFIDCIVAAKVGPVEYAVMITDKDCDEKGNHSLNVIIFGRNRCGVASDHAQIVGYARANLDEHNAISDDHCGKCSAGWHMGWMEGENPEKLPMTQDLVDAYGIDATHAKAREFREAYVNTMVRSLGIVTFAGALLNCRNVHAVEQSCSPKLAKRYLERHGHKRPRYYVLDIEPMKQIIRKESGGEPVTLAKALHICRGHFKNFDDKPLFGRLKGTYWWQPHVRGSAEAGVVEKDYRIKL